MLCLTVYAAIISSTANHGSWDASVIHNEFSRRRYFLATLTPGLVRLVRVSVRVRVRMRVRVRVRVRVKG